MANGIERRCQSSKLLTLPTSIRLTKILLLAIVLTAITNLYLIQAQASNSPDLYSSVDDVLRLNTTTFNSTLFQNDSHKNITFMVQFYNTYCGHCQMFSPIYKELGTRVKNWTSVFKLAAIDCSKDENVQTCSENRIQGYPTIFIFPPNPKPTDIPLDVRSLNIDWTVDDFEETIVDYLTNLTTTVQDRQVPLVVDALQPISEESEQNIKRIYPIDIKQDNQFFHSNNHNTQDLMILLETDKSYIGKKLIVEYFRINSKLELRRVLISNQKLLKELLSDDDFSKLDDNQPLLIKLGGLTSEGFTFRKAQVLVKGEEKHLLATAQEHERLDFIYNRFRMFFEHYYSIELENENNYNNKSYNINRPSIVSTETQSREIDNELVVQHLLQSDPSIKRKVFAVDLLKSISYMITHEIKIKGDLNPSEFNTVRNILTILKKYLPLEKWDSGVYKFILDMRTRLDDNRGSFEVNGVKAQEMRDILDLSGADAVRLKYNRENWVSCFESDRRQRGYTCSLWLLFHTLTLGEYSKAAPVRTKPTLVLYTMRDYITKFLGCTVCSSNYAKETESLDNSIISRNSSVLWLWSTHNKINQRLNNERPTNERKNLIDILFPNHDSCAKCIKTNIEEIGVDGKSIEDIEWDMDKVMNYMLDTYRPDKIVTPLEMSTLIQGMKKKFNYDFLNKDGNFESSKFDSYGPGNDLNKSTVDQWKIQSLFSTSDISLCLFLYLACIMIVAIVCMALNPKLKRFKTK